MLLLKRLLPILLLLTSCHRAGSVAADAGGTAPDVSQWPLFSGEGYEIRMPGTPAVGPLERAESDTAGLFMRAVSYLTPDKKAQYGVVTFDFPRVPGPIAFGSPLYLTVHGRVMSGFHAKVLSDVAGTYYALPGHQMELERPSAEGTPAARISARLVVRERRLYVISVVREATEPDARARQFLDSFRLTGP